MANSFARCLGKASTSSFSRVGSFFRGSQNNWPCMPTTQFLLASLMMQHHQSQPKNTRHPLVVTSRVWPLCHAGKALQGKRQRICTCFEALAQPEPFSGGLLWSPFGCGSKKFKRYHNGTRGNMDRNMDQHLRNPCLILSHTHSTKPFESPRRFGSTRKPPRPGGEGQPGDAAAQLAGGEASTSGDLTASGCRSLVLWLFEGKEARKA